MTAGPPQHTGRAGIMEYQTGNMTLLLYSSPRTVFLLLIPLISHITLLTPGQKGRGQYVNMLQGEMPCRCPHFECGLGVSIPRKHQRKIKGLPYQLERLVVCVSILQHCPNTDEGWSDRSCHCAQEFSLCDQSFDIQYGQSSREWGCCVRWPLFCGIHSFPP